WNRLVEVRDTSDNLIASYEYNGLNQRIKKTVGSTVTKSFFNENWQEIESITNNQVTSYVWGLRYIDDLVLREKEMERLYSLADPNWNVIAICDVSGDIQERYTYDVFGKRNVFNAAFILKVETVFYWNRAFTGQVLDVETGLMLYRNRFYHVELGRFVSRDPIGYDGNDKNVYRYLQNVPIIVGDPLGLFAPGVDLSGMWPSSQPCCDGTTYDPATQDCCNNKHIYDLATSCCENKTVVSKESVWRCIRPINNPVLGQIGNWHSYMCCNGPNNNCFNFASGTQKGDSVPKEYITTGICTEYKVCPNKRKNCCDSPKAPWSYNFVTGTTCNAWTNRCVEGSKPAP
ncbi:MAG: RHS repeat-associated core domain-containing protein, partial [Planctomycetaceae bacterium]|nr:RHS repeat-associated core domain-containing protein [Planctomycetaceae bacterium]